MHRFFSASFASLVLLALASGPAAAAKTPSAPSIKPSLKAASEVISTQDATLMRTALEAVDDGNWSKVRRIEGQVYDETAKDILTWYRARRDPAMGFDAINQALDRLQDWPEFSTLRARAEEKIADSALQAADRVAWFESHDGAKTGAGGLAYAEALSALGRDAEALTELRKVWHGRSLSRDLSRRTMSLYSQNLTQADHRKRADFLLWTRQTSAAERLKPLLTPDYTALTEARIRLINRRRGVDRAIDAVPTALKSNPGLVFDRAYWRRKRGMTSDVSDLLRSIDGEAIPVAGRSRLWTERNIAMRRALRDAEFVLAYDLASRHGLTSGASFAEAEWSAGWISLRHLNRPERGLQHFETLKAGVGTPISLARANYWIGRAKEALNDTEGAKAAYAEAATYSFTYYGQLAADKTTERVIDLPEATVITAEDEQAFSDRSLVKAMRLFAENGWDAAFRKFAYHLDDQLERTQDFELLARFGREYHYKDIGVRGAKAGLARGVVAADAAYPLVDYPLLREPQVERSLMLALSRQESEMNPGAISHANARGLMQFVPATARNEARKRGLPYRTSWLTDDPGYNMTLGGAHLDTLLGQFNGSYIMTAAAYNAGPHRPRAWIGDYGDPRAGEVDPIDWVEFIPFRETRNYVQRVLENTQVYRHRLSGEPETIRLSDDLQRGRFGNR